MRQITVLVVDDEPLARLGLKALLAQDPDVCHVHEAMDADEALAVAGAVTPDIVFLDVQMPGVDGISLGARFGSCPGFDAGGPAVVFVTAHEQHAVGAFDLNAVDYLLKPVTAERFALALQRAKARLGWGAAAPVADRFRTGLQQQGDSGEIPRRFAIRTSGKTVFVDLRDIQWVSAVENYVQLHDGSRSHLVHSTMAALERELIPQGFVRVHRSIIVNVRKITELKPLLHGEYRITLDGGVRVQSGRTYRESIKAIATGAFPTTTVVSSRKRQASSSN